MSRRGTYRLSKVGTGWEYLPEREQQEKREYESIYNRILRKEKKIIKMRKDLRDEQVILRDLKKQRTEKYNQLVKWHKSLIPTISIGFSKTRKKRVIEYPTKLYPNNDIETNGNNSWSITLKLQGKTKSIYIGTTKNVLLKIKELYGFEKWEDTDWDKMNPQRVVSQSNRLKILLKSIVEPELMKLISEHWKRDDVNSFLETKYKGMDFLKKLP